MHFTEDVGQGEINPRKGHLLVTLAEQSCPLREPETGSRSQDAGPPSHVRGLCRLTLDAEFPHPQMQVTWVPGPEAEPLPLCGLLFTGPGRPLTFPDCRLFTSVGGGLGSLMGRSLCTDAQGSAGSSFFSSPRALPADQSAPDAACSCGVGWELVPGNPARKGISSCFAGTGSASLVCLLVTYRNSHPWVEISAHMRGREHRQV